MNVAQLQAKDERRFDRGAWLTLAVWLGWMVVIIAGMFANLQYPSDGWASVRGNSDQGAYTINSRLTTVPSPLQTGDRVIAINGQPLTPDAIPPLPQGLREGQSVRYTIQRASSSGTTQTLDVDVTLVRAGMRGMLDNFVARWQDNPRDFIVAFLCFLVVAVAFFLRPGNSGARYLFLFFSFYVDVQWFGFATSDLYTYALPPVLTFIVSFIPAAWAWYFFPTLTLIPLSFPVVKAPLRRFPHLLPVLLYGVPLALSAASVASVPMTHSYAFYNSIGLVFIPVVVVAVVTLFVTLVHNWRTVREPVARLQLRWVTLGMVGGLGVPFGIMMVELLAIGRITSAFDFMLWFLLILPICLTIAITRYRLFDIDVIIRRTVTYAIVTALLLAVYFGGVVALQQVFVALMGQRSEAAVVLSTLVIYALFVPLRNRIQTAVDHRFYRRKYNAEEALAMFALTARDETNPRQLSARLMDAVDETLQPTRVALWLNEVAQKGKVRS